MSGQTNTTTPYRRRATQAERAAARSTLYRFLSLGFLYPEAENLARLRSGIEEAAVCLKFLGYSHVLPTLHSAREALPLTCKALEKHYLKTWGHTISPTCSPYEMEYGPAHIYQKTQGLADVSGFYHAFGLKLSSQTRERPDHLSMELEFMHFLTWKEVYGLKQGHDSEKVTLCRQAQAKFLEEHLNWLHLFAQGLSQKAEGSFLAIWGQLVEDFLSLEAQSMGVTFQKPKPAQERTWQEARDEECTSCPHALVEDGSTNPRRSL